MITDILLLQGRAQSNFAISATAVQSAVLADGVYDIWSTVDCWVAVGPDAATGLTTGTGYVLFANNVLTLHARAGDRIGAICAATISGTLALHQVGASWRD